MRRAGILVGAALLLLLAAMGFKGALLTLPEVLGAAAPGQFDTPRAMARLGRILGDERPHPVDSAAGDAVRARLIGELRAIGLKPRITDGVTCNGGAKSRTVSCARIRNVLATIGTAEGRHVLVAVHYDSTPVGPGAADDGIGVAVALETAAMLARRDLKKPVTFLFDEGEETGLLGARAFLERDPLANRVDALVNLEARGVTGPATMFETSHPNGPALAHFARSADRPSANSLATDFARMIPNSTDVEVFKDRGWTILNFAIIGNETRYHSPGDTLAALDPRSVQHMGDQALAAIADMADGPRAESTGAKVYADVLGRNLVVLPVTVALIGLGLLLIGALFVGWHRRTGLARAAGAILATLSGAAGLSFLAQSLVGLIRAGEYWRAYPAGIGTAVYAATLLAGVAALLWIGRRTAVDRLRAAFWLVFLILGAGISAAAPGGSIFFLAPPLAALIGMAAETRIRGAERAGAIVAAILLFLTWAPLLAMAETLLDYDAAWIFAPVAAIVMLPVLIELAPAMAELDRKRAIGAVGAITLAAWAIVALLPAYSADRKQQFGIEHVWDQKAGKARWMIVNDGAALPSALAGGGWRRGVEVPWSGRKRWAAPASGRANAPAADRLSDRATPEGRRLSLRLRANGAETVTLRAPPEAALLAAKAGGSERGYGKGKAKDPYLLRCHGRACDGLQVDLLLANPKPLDWTIVGIRSGLPASAAPLIRARPATAAPQYSPDSTIGIDRIRL